MTSYQLNWLFVLQLQLGNSRFLFHGKSWAGSPFWYLLKMLLFVLVPRMTERCVYDAWFRNILGEIVIFLWAASLFSVFLPTLVDLVLLLQLQIIDYIWGLASDNSHTVLWFQWDAEASERRELAAKKAALASAEIAKFSKCVSGMAVEWHLMPWYAIRLGLGGNVSCSKSRSLNSV